MTTVLSIDDYEITTSSLRQDFAASDMGDRQVPRGNGTPSRFGDPVRGNSQESGTKWGRSRHQALPVRLRHEGGVPATKSPARSSFSTRVRIWSRRCAPLGDQRIYCFLTMRLDTTWLIADSMKAFEIASPER